MALLICDGPEGCGTAYSVGAVACPHCGNTVSRGDHDPEPEQPGSDGGKAPTPAKNDK